MSGETQLERVERPVFSGLRLDRDDEHTEVEVSLAFENRETTGFARGGIGDDAVAVVAAQAVLHALRKLAGPGLELELVWIQVGVGPLEDHPPLAQVLIQSRVGEQDQLFVGAALVRGDEAVATARAVLDALNRPLTLHFQSLDR